MTSTFTDIYESMGHSKELNDCKHDTVIECCCCNKSIHEISIPLKYFTVNCNWYCCF